MLRVQTLSTSRLEATVEAAEDVIDVRVTGEIDIANVDEFRVLLWSLPTGSQIVRLDLSGLEFLSAAGVRALIAVHLRLRGRGGQLVLCRPNPLVRRILRVSRVNRVIPVVGVPTPVADRRGVEHLGVPRSGVARSGADRPTADRSSPDRLGTERAVGRAWPSGQVPGVRPVGCGGRAA